VAILGEFLHQPKDQVARFRVLNVAEIPDQDEPLGRGRVLDIARLILQFIAHGRPPDLKPGAPGGVPLLRAYTSLCAFRVICESFNLYNLIWLTRQVRPKGRRADVAGER